MRRSLLFATFCSLLLVASAVQAQLAKPEDISCRNVGRATDQVRVRWKDVSDDETAYRIERRIGGADWVEIGDIDADSNSFEDSGVDFGDANRYRVRAYRSGDDSFGPYSDVCRSPMALDSDLFRVYYRPYAAADCPPVGGRPMCVPTTTNGAGQNETAARIGGILDDSRDGLIDIGFKDLAKFEGDAPLPTDLGWCDGGGCAGANTFGDNRRGGIGLAPEYMGAYDPATMTGDPGSYLISLHEAFHQQQYSYGGLLTDPASAWVYEGQARSIQDKVCMGSSPANCVDLDSEPGGIANYIGEVNGFLNNPNRTITTASYNSALFWTYITEQYGTTASEPELGMDFMVEFWEQSADDFDEDGIGVIDKALAALGHDERFADVFRDFGVANYAKRLNGPSVPDKYKYVDETQPPGVYNDVALSLDEFVSVDEQVGPFLTDVNPWATRYFRIRPDPAVATITAEFRADTTDTLAYTLLAIKGGDIAMEISQTSRALMETFPNDDYDEVVVIVSGRQNLVNFRYAFNATDPILNILDPVTGRAAIAGDPSSPEKFLIKLEVLSPTGGGEPMEGLAFEDFEITVGPETLTDSDLITPAYIQGQYWFLVRAPEQSTGGLKDLTVDWNGTLTETEISAVDYKARVDADNVLTIDRSGSMDDFGGVKLAAAKQAANLYVDSWRAGDGIGVVSFANSGRIDLPLTDWSTTSRDDAIVEIEDLSALGATAIGDGLDKALDELTRVNNAGRDWNIILISDGLETGTPEIADFLDTWESRDDAGDKNPRVHTVALGPDADRAKMEDLADDTGGTYHYASAPVTRDSERGASADVVRELAEIYRVIAETVAREQQVFSERDEITAIQSRSHVIPIDGSVREAVFAIKWDRSVGLGNTVTLFEPDGENAGSPTLTADGHLLWRVTTPEIGDWTLALDPFVIGRGATPTPYIVEASVKADLVMQLFLGLAPSERLTGRDMPILVSIAESAAVTGASVTATVTDPAGTNWVLTLFDDGNHGDGAAGDGFYGNVFTRTGTPGSYILRIAANGSGPVAGPFSRRLRSAFHMRGAADTDGDGLPDWWEEANGTDPASPDDDEDPDDDGRTNGQEFETGTHPFDPDTDDGGEGDATDPDPLDPADDRLPQPRAHAWPGVGQIDLRFTIDPAYTGVRIWRSTDASGPYAVVAADAAPDGQYLDGAVTNGTEYCYRVAGLGADSAVSGLSPVTCATPSLDPIPPTGLIRIAGGAPATTTVNVELGLFADDNPSERESEAPGLPELPDSAPDGAIEMKLSNRGGFEGAVWQPFQPTLPWTLDPVDGLATVYVIYRDESGNVSDILHDTIRVVGGTAPTAEANGPYSGLSSDPVTLTAAGSADPDGSIVAYEWDVDGDGLYDFLTSLPELAYSFPAGFDGLIGLRVTDDDGLVGTDQAVAAVTDDSDNDGVPSDAEDAGPNAGDGNDDGIADSEQPDVANVPNDGGGITIAVDGDCDQVLNAEYLTQAEVYDTFGEDQRWVYPFGFAAMELPCGSADVRLIFHGADGLDAAIHRKTVGSGYFKVPGSVISSVVIGAEPAVTVDFTLIDNGPGDADPTVNRIRDPSGLGLFVARVPLLGPAALGLLAVVLMLFGIAGLARRARSGPR
jgi:Mg-chelatase subunit ChlD